MAKKRYKLNVLRGDKPLWVVTLLMCAFSLLVVYSSTATLIYDKLEANSSSYLFSQFIYLGVGFLSMLIIHFLDYRDYMRLNRLLFNLFLLLVFLTPFIGTIINGEKRWITVPLLGVTFQPSQFLTIALVMVLAQQLGARQSIIAKIPILPSFSYKQWQVNRRKNNDILNRTTKPLVLPILLSAGLVMPSNMSTALVIVVTAFLMLIIARVRFGEVVRLALVIIVVGAVGISIMTAFGVGRAGTWKRRIENFVDSKSGKADDDNDIFQQTQAKIAVVSGGVLGKGPGNSTQRVMLPNSYNDFAYAFIIEEYGLLGGLVILLMYLWIFYRSVVIARRSQRFSPAFLVMGLTFVILIEAFVNMLVSVGIIPITGQPLPLLSRGGSAIVATCVALGMILSVSRQTDAQLLLEQKLSQANSDNQNEPYSEGSSQQRVNQSDGRYENSGYDEDLSEDEDNMNFQVRDFSNGSYERNMERKPEREVEKLYDDESNN